MRDQIIRTAVVAGILAAFLCTTYLLLLYALDSNPFGRFKYLFIALYAIPFALAMRHFRDKQNKGRMRAQQGIFLGFVLNATAVLAYGLLVLGMLTVFPDIVELHMEQTIALLEASKEQVIEQFDTATYQETYQKLTQMNANDLAIDQAVGLLMAGVVHTFLFMLIFKN